MSISSDLLNAPKEFLLLYKAGKEAARQGDHDKAHDLFRKAIEVDPYHEQVWLWLASVVKTDEDRRVCFENVLELNPSNPTARQQLRRLEEKALAEAMQPHHTKKKRPAWKRWTLRLLFVAVLTAVAVGAALGLGVI